APAPPTGPRDLSFDNGARAVVWPKPGSGTVVVAVTVAAGSQDEAPGREGSSHYLEHLLFDGFDDLDERGVTESFEKLSAYVNAFTRDQATVFFVLVPRDNAAEAARLLVGMLTRSTLGPEVYEKEKKVILEELAKDHARPTTVEEETLRAALWEGTPLGHPVLGFPESIAATGREQVLEYWKRHYVPAAMRVMVSGDLPRAELEDLARRFAALPAAPPPPPREDPALWPGWGLWQARPKPEGAGAASGGPPMGHGGSPSAVMEEGGRLTVSLLAPPPDRVSLSALEIATRWLGADDGPLASVLVPDLAESVGCSRLPRQPRDLVDIDLRAKKGVDPGDLLARLLGALEAAAGGPADVDVMRLQRAWAAERALTGQRLHYAAVFYGGNLAAATGSLAAALDPQPVTPAQVRAAVRALLADLPASARAAWVGEGGPSALQPLPAAIAPAPRKAGAELHPGPLGSLVTTLPNGLEVGILPETGNDVFGIHLLVADRGFREKNAPPGTTDLLHRLLDRGTLLGGTQQVAHRLERAGITVKTADNPMIPFDNRYNVPDFSYVRLEGPAASLEEGLAVLAEMIRQAAWDTPGWSTALQGLRAARKSEARGGGGATARLRRALFGPDHPLARPLAGRPDDPVPSAEDLRAFWGRWPHGYFAPPHLLLTVASPVPAGETLAMVRDYFSGGADAEPVRGPYPPAKAHGGGEIIEPGEATQVSVLAARLVAVDPADRAALLTAVDALSDRMVARIREELGLAYRLGAGVRVVPGGAWLLSASVGTRPENQQQVRTLLEELITELRSTPVEAERLERLAARRRLSSMLRGLSAASRAYRLGRRLFEGPSSTLDIAGADFATVTAEQVQAAAKKYLDPERMLVIVAP
ncbi:MAG TPA: insulinase family protein, partial [Acidobacteria bacterium]|nr:insulinase family protein [Acidobacteriota bacterium]